MFSQLSLVASFFPLAAALYNSKHFNSRASPLILPTPHATGIQSFFAFTNFQGALVVPVGVVGNHLEEYQDDRIKMTENHLVRLPKMVEDCKRNFF